jgi:hypothetical protein
LQAFGRSNPQTLQSKNHRRCKIRLLLKGLQDVHGQLDNSMSDLFEQTVQVLVSLAMSADAETLDDATLNLEVDALVVSAVLRPRV